jgi:hypothetical protein
MVITRRRLPLCSPPANSKELRRDSTPHAATMTFELQYHVAIVHCARINAGAPLQLPSAWPSPWPLTYNICFLRAKPQYATIPRKACHWHAFSHRPSTTKPPTEPFVRYWLLTNPPTAAAASPAARKAGGIVPPRGTVAWTPPAGAASRHAEERPQRFFRELVNLRSPPPA